MREIVFRGKKKGDGKWIQGLLFANIFKNPVIRYFKEFPFQNCLPLQKDYEVLPETVGQYTGLTDKNGRKIFENDIVIVTTINIDEEDGYGIIVWDEDAARYIIELLSIVIDFDNVYGHEVEVIGNIHDNPELLKTGGVGHDE